VAVPGQDVRLGHGTASADAWISGGNPHRGVPLPLRRTVLVDLSEHRGGGRGQRAVHDGPAGDRCRAAARYRDAPSFASTMLMLMWTASLPPENNLFMDDHIVYALGPDRPRRRRPRRRRQDPRPRRWWARTSLVLRHSWLDRAIHGDVAQGGPQGPPFRSRNGGGLIADPGRVSVHDRATGRLREGTCAARPSSGPVGNRPRGGPRSPLVRHLVAVVAPSAYWRRLVESRKPTSRRSSVKWGKSPSSPETFHGAGTALAAVVQIQQRRRYRR
jgi:hypothetical protein